MACFIKSTTIELVMKYAFLHKNFRDLTFERKTIFLAHLATILFCFTPWFSADPVYEEEFFFNAFQGTGFLIGFFIFLISLIIVLLFMDQLFEKRKIKLSFSENILYFSTGAQQILLLILMWSVLASVGNQFESHSIRFGIFLTFMAQIAGLVATFLNFQIEKQNQAKNFFQHTSKENNDESPTTLL